MRRVPPRGAPRDADAASLVARPGPVRSTPIALVARRNLALWSALAPQTAPETARLSPAAAALLEHLTQYGAAFFDDLVSGTRLLRTQVEAGLGELVALGLASSDSFAGLRALLVPSNERRPIGGRQPRRRRLAPTLEDAGRWVRASRATDRSAAETTLSPEDLETVARLLLRRWGVVFRRLLDREEPMPPWRDLLRVLRRLEARGEIRGGRFVEGPTGEQYALPEAVSLLREVRRSPQTGTLVAVSGADPLNLTGILVPGARVAAIASNRILYRDGVPLAVREGRETSILAPLEPAAEWEARQALVRRTRAAGARAESSARQSRADGARTPVTTR
jgi:ATP-dependent Lhr-like helicase